MALWLLPKIASSAWDLLTKWFGTKSNDDRDATLGAAGLSAAYQDISRLLFRENKGVKPFIFFFDDLDRCSPDRVATVLESVHSLTATGCVVFLACDDEYVIAALNSHYERIASSYTNGANFGRRYLEKIVQISFRLPLVRANSVFELGIATRPQQRGNGDLSSPPSPPDESTKTPGVPDGKQPTTPDDGQPPTTNVGAPGRPVEKDLKPLDEVHLSQIVGDLLENAVEPLGLNIRQVKSIANTLKLYLGISASNTEEKARRIAAFVFADKLDPAWLDALYFGKSRKNTLIGCVSLLDRRLAEMVGTQKEEMLELYNLLGRRPVLKAPSRSGNSSPK